MFQLCNASEIHQIQQKAPAILTVAEVPVHSVHSDTVDTGTALETLMAAPDSMLTEKIPPKMVGENYCFAVDGNKVSVPDITADDRFWRHTSRPTKYFYSTDLKSFKNVHVTIVKEKVVSARLKAPDNVKPSVATGRSATSATTTAKSGAVSTGGQRRTVPNDVQRRTGSTATYSRSDSNSSVSVDGNQQNNIGSKTGTKPPLRRHHRRRLPKSRSTDSGDLVAPGGDDLPFEHIYKVTRFYSFWRTCTNFHRIVTLITPAVPGFHKDFRKRIFIQFLWRNPRPEEKMRVAREFDPKQQTLLANMQS